MPCPWELGGSGDWRLHKGATGAVGTYTALCATGKGSFVTEKQDCSQDSGFERTSSQNVHRMCCVRALKKPTGKLFPFKFRLYFTAPVKCVGRHCPLCFQTRWLSFMEKCQIWSPHCGDHLSCAAMSQVRAPWHPHIIQGTQGVRLLIDMRLWPNNERHKYDDFSKKYSGKSSLSYVASCSRKKFSLLHFKCFHPGRVYRL